MAWLGALYLLIALGMLTGIPLYFNHRFGAQIRYKQRRRQVERVANQAEFDRQVIRDVVHEWGRDPNQHHPHGRSRRGR